MEKAQKEYNKENPKHRNTDDRNCLSVPRGPSGGGLGLSSHSNGLDQDDMKSKHNGLKGVGHRFYSQGPVSPGAGFDITFLEK